jgi:hypothetical protein
MNDYNDKPFMDYLNAVDKRLEALCGRTSEQSDMALIAACQEDGVSPEDCAADTARRIRIRELNDLCRTAMGVAGRVVQTPGICALPPEDQSAIRERVETFEDFGEDNDPHGEHDFGAFDHKGRKIFWKIDYYDPTLTKGSEDPTDPKQTCRLLTILLAEEW